MLRTTLRFALAALILLLTAVPAHAQSASADWRTDVPCTTERNPALVVADSPRTATVPGCVEAYCITVADAAATGRPWPRGYNPAPDWLQLAPVTIRTYRGEGQVVHLLVVGADRSGSR